MAQALSHRQCRGSINNITAQAGGGVAIGVPRCASEMLPAANEKRTIFFCGRIPVAAEFFAVLDARENCAKFFFGFDRRLKRP